VFFVCGIVANHRLKLADFESRVRHGSDYDTEPSRAKPKSIAQMD
jgi:hypothetical protein